MTENKSTQPQLPWWLAAIGIIGALFIGNATGTGTTTTTTTTTTTIPAPVGTTTTVPSTNQPGGVQPYFNPNASWNRPAAELGRAEASLQRYSNVLFNYGGGRAPPGRFSVAFGDYSVPWYPAEDATTTARIYQTTWAQALFKPQLAIGSQIPWNPRWTAGSGNDNILHIIKHSTGEVWKLSGYGQNKFGCIDFFGPNSQKGYDVNNSRHLCISGASYYSNLYSASDVDGTTTKDRGMGINKAALLVRAAEVESGVIRHALNLSITNTMFGQPACNPVKGPNTVGFGTECGGYVAPATQLERINPDAINCPTKQVVSVEERSKTVPEGMRFAIDISDVEIQNWLDSRNYVGELRETARIFAVALRDYGFIISESGCWGMHIETDSVRSGAAVPVWKSLGVQETGDAYPYGDLMWGLITRSNLYVVAVP